jgi:hypothetical protein
VTEPDRAGPVSWIGLLLVCAAAALAAVIEALLVPIYAGSTPAGIAVVLALASNIALPRLAVGVFPRALAVAAPFVLWLVVVFVFGVYGRPEGDVILPGGGLQWVSYGVMLGGALAGAITVALSVPPRARGQAPDGSVR